MPGMTMGMDATNSMDIEDGAIGAPSGIANGNGT